MSQWKDVWKSVDGTNPPESTYMFRFYNDLLGGISFRNKRVLEIGCGTGVNSLLMAKLGAKVTLLDYERAALRIAKKTAEALSVDAEFVHGDVFECGFENEFDIVHSEGVVEHFLGSKRQRIIDLHARALVKGGRCVIIAPNSSSPPYVIGKRLAQKARTWVYGGEYPYIKDELVGRMRRAGLSVERVLGGEFLASFLWMFAPLWLVRHERFLLMTIRRPNNIVYRMNYSNFFANRWGRVIGVAGVKK